MPGSRPFVAEIHVADHGEDAAAADEINVLNLALTQLGVERLPHGPLGQRGVGLGDGKADRMLRAAL